MCPNYGDPVDGLYYRPCASVRKCLNEVCFTICDENEILNTSESSNDNTNVVDPPQEPFIFNQDPGENSSQSPPHIDHHCCYGCGDLFGDIFCQRCTCESCGKGAHYGYNCPPKVPIISNPEPCYHQNVDEFPKTLPSFHPTPYSGDENSFTYDSNLNFVDDSPNPSPQPSTYSYEFCGNDAYYSHDCPPQVSFIYNPEPCYNQDFNFPQTPFNFQQQYLCCENYEGPRATFKCQPMNEDYYHEQNSCYDPNSFSFDQFQPLQYTVNHPIFNSQNELMGQMTSICDMIPICYDDDDDEESSIPLKDIIISGLPPCVAITPVLTTKEPVDSLIMVDKLLDTIPETESDELIKYSVENLVQTPNESEDLSDGECDLPLCDDSPKSHLTFSNPLFDINDDFTSSDDESFSREDVDQIGDEVLDSIDSISPGIDHFDAESDLLESLLNRDFSIDSSPKIDSLLDEFAGELTLLKSIPPGIDDDNLDPEGKIHLVERLLYDNSSPRPPGELNVENSIESFSPSPNPVEDSDSLMEEIDIFFGPDDSIPPGIESDDYDSEDDDNSTSLPEFESFRVDYPDLGDSTIDVVEDIPVDVPNILPTHPTLHMDFDFIPFNDLGSDHDVSSPSGDRNKIYDLGICIEVESTRFLTNLSPVIDTLLPFSSENEDKVFNHGVLASEEKSPPSSSHRGFKAF
ncbi:hypothetical protein Tco_0989355 [Tanacetum coccineum]|uniref:Uncharacterized protein n=1 Tax=Tanacetum coccineum TaxID=301880 RepID=A0ABQ5ETE2_9ASTR